MLTFLPKYIFPKLTDISVDLLKQKEISLLLMDFDNTMLPYITNEPTKELLRWIQEMQGSGITLCIVSNSKKPRVPRFSEQYDVPCVTRARKPFPKGIYEALTRYQADKMHTALVGDQIYTDVLGANCAGIASIIVKSINNHNIWLKLRHVLEVPFLGLAHNRRVKL